MTPPLPQIYEEKGIYEKTPSSASTATASAGSCASAASAAAKPAQTQTGVCGEHGGDPQLSSSKKPGSTWKRQPLPRPVAALPRRTALKKSR
jgi:hypothetical protein